MRSPATDWVAGLSPVARGVRARPDARAARGARRPPARLSRRSTSSARTASRRRRGMTAALLRGEGLASAPTRRRTSPAGTSGSIPTRTGFERAVARVRPAAERLGATQFETLTAAALAEFAGRCRRRGRRGRPRRAARRDERAPRSRGRAHQRRPRSHRVAGRDAGGDRRGEACGRPGRRLGRPLRAGVAGARPLVRRGRPSSPGAATSRSPSPRRRRSSAAGRSVRGGGAVPPGPASSASRRGPLEIRDGAHNLDGVGWLLPRLPDRRYVVVASILRRQGRRRDARRALGPRATRSSRPSRRNDARACPPTNLQRLGVDGSRGRRRRQPRRARSPRARDRRTGRGGPGDGVAVPPRRPRRAPRRRTIQHGPRLSVFVFAAIVIAAFAGIAFAVGYVVGKMLL